MKRRVLFVCFSAVSFDNCYSSVGIVYTHLNVAVVAVVVVVVVDAEAAATTAGSSHNLGGDYSVVQDLRERWWW